MGARQKNPAKTKVTLDDGSVLDLDADEDWNGHKLNKRQKLFIFWYTYPYDSDLKCYHNASNAARMAGYKYAQARQVGYLIKTRYKDLVEKFDAKYHKVGIDEAISRIIQRRIARAEYDVKDFYQEDYDDKGNLRLTLKSLDALTPEQRLIVDNIDNKNGHLLYQLPNRSKEMDAIMEIKSRMEGNAPGGMNINVLVEQMRLVISQSMTIIRNNSKIAADAGNFIVNPDKLLEEE